MPRPTNKKELFELAEVNFNKLLNFIDALPDEIRNGVYENDELNDRDKTISDVICHLHEWHLMMENWYKIGMSGKKPDIPAEDVRWQTLPVLNRRIYEKYKGTELKKAITISSHYDWGLKTIKPLKKLVA